MSGKHTLTPYQRARKGYQKLSERSLNVFHSIPAGDEVQLDARDLEDALERALLKNEERGLRELEVPVPDSLNTAFVFGHIGETGESFFRAFFTRVYHTLGIPLKYPWLTHDAEKRVVRVRVF